MGQDQGSFGENLPFLVFALVYISQVMQLNHLTFFSFCVLLQPTRLNEEKTNKLSACTRLQSSFALVADFAATLIIHPSHWITFYYKVVKRQFTDVQDTILPPPKKCPFFFCGQRVILHYKLCKPYQCTITKKKVQPLLAYS